MATGASVLDMKLTTGAGKGAKIGVAVFGVALIIGFICMRVHTSHPIWHRFIPAK